MRSQYPQYGQGQDWEREERERQRYFEDYPGQQYQQSQRGIEHPGMEYYGSAGGYGGGQGEYPAQPGGYGAREGGGGFRQQEAFHPGGGYERETREMEQRHGLYGFHQQSAQPQGYSQGAYGQQGFGQQQGYSPQQYGYGQPGGQLEAYGQSAQGRSVRRGPKDYTRSDERLLEAVCERLAEDRTIDVSEVSVQVREGRVILEGTVPERRMKHRIEDIADNCWGVKDVENRVRVQIGQYGMKASDLSLTSGSPTSNNASGVAAGQGAGGTGLASGTGGQAKKAGSK